MPPFIIFVGGCVAVADVDVAAAAGQQHVAGGEQLATAQQQQQQSNVYEPGSL